MKAGWIITGILSLALLGITGCAKKADTSKPVDQIKAEVESMSLADLQSMAQAYANEIMKKKAEADKVRAQLKDLSPKDLLGEKGRAIKDDVSKITSDVSELTKRYNIYADKFRKMGGDASKIQIG